MSIGSWLKNVMNLKVLPLIKSSPPIAKEADVKSPRNWLKELYGDSPEPKNAPKFIHAEKRQPIQSLKTGDHNLSQILDEALEDPAKKDHS